MAFIADFHIHSMYSRATSKDMDIEHLNKAAKLKGIDLVGTGDFTHPVWLNDLKRTLIPQEDGLYKYKDTLFVLTTEVSNVFFKKGRVKKVHNLIFAPNFYVAEKISNKLGKFGDLQSDGRPTLKMEASDLVEEVLGVSDEAFVVPAHIWTPWFSLFGANSGFDSIEDCFGKYTKYVYALETGLSSDPEMNWRVSSLDRFTLISNSDAHSPSKLGREANVFSQKLGYKEIKEVLKMKDSKRFLYTIEFFPQEGKYHYDGHRRCQICLSPEESRKYNNFCPKCGEKLTIGVMHRIEILGDRKRGYVPSGAIPFKHLVPLSEIIAEVLNQGVDTKGVEEKYERIVHQAGGELKALLETSREELSLMASPEIVEGIMRVREGRVRIKCGYDGVYGKISIFDKGERKEQRQLNLF
ncbi:DNA helicase UvrD [Candidatus Aerophobetes bacterium]|uniref:DNA helicase UvrD n=1 Tax=Aerophobetes bacterium TaxID=2030807 RepID=A0A662D667_UNCAE|nr:MAG: DNA helicase UvrD [Candidatus Aerophobetes bacterium]